MYPSLQVCSDILSSYPSSNALVAVARCLIAVVVTCCYPLQAHPARGCIASVVGAAKRATKRRAEARRRRLMQQNVRPGRQDTGGGAGLDTGGGHGRAGEGWPEDEPPWSAAARNGSGDCAGDDGWDGGGDDLAAQARDAKSGEAHSTASTAGTDVPDVHPGWPPPAGMVPPVSSRAITQGSTVSSPAARLGLGGSGRASPRLGGGSAPAGARNEAPRPSREDDADDDAETAGGRRLHMIISACFVLASVSIALVVTDLGVVLSVSCHSPPTRPSARMHHSISATQAHALATSRSPHHHHASLPTRKPSHTPHTTLSLPPTDPHTSATYTHPHAPFPSTPSPLLPTAVPYQQTSPPNYTNHHPSPPARTRPPISPPLFRQVVTTLNPLRDPLLPPLLCRARSSGPPAPPLSHTSCPASPITGSAPPSSGGSGWRCCAPASYSCHSRSRSSPSRPQRSPERTKVGVPVLSRPHLSGGEGDPLCKGYVKVRWVVVSVLRGRWMGVAPTALFYA